MSLTERKRNSVLNPSLLESITQTISQSIITTTTSPSDQLAKLTVNTPTTSSSIEISSDIPQLAARAEKQVASEEQTPLIPLLTLKHEFQFPSQTPRRSNNFLKGCKW
ncbi:unnamed protein product [Rotaria sp. Silwood1]|nr:unnamed protein product [Rotaria sp. Silwood1]